MHKLFPLAHLCIRVLFLQIIKLPLCINYVQKVREATIIAGRREINRALACRHRDIKFRHAQLLCLISIERRVDLLNSV